MAGRELGLRQEQRRNPRSAGLGFCSTEPFLTEVALCVIAALLGITSTISGFTLALILAESCKRLCNRKQVHQVAFVPFTKPSGAGSASGHEDEDAVVSEQEPLLPTEIINDILTLQGLEGQKA